MQEVRKGKEMTDLTEKWKKKQLERGSYYYVKTKMGNILIDCINYDRPNHDGFLYDVEEVLAPVPTYDEYKAMQAELAELKEKVADQRTDLESARWYQTVQNEDISKLRGLLKECKEWFECFAWNKEYKHKSVNILARINAAIDESEKKCPMHWMK